MDSSINSGETVVTEAMIRAARPLLWDDQVQPWEDRDCVLIKIYLAMEKARKAEITS